MMRYVYDQKELDESFEKVACDFEQLCEDLDNFEECLDNLEVFIEDQNSMQYDACLAYLKQLKEIIVDCEIRFDIYNGKYDSDYEKKKHVITRLERYIFMSILKKVYKGD